MTVRFWDGDLNPVDDEYTAVYITIDGDTDRRLFARLAASSKDAEELAETFHAALLEDPDCVAWEWHELNDEHRAWKTKAAQAVIDAGWVKRGSDV